MKSLKKLLAVLIVVTLMAGMIAVPVFAASFDYEEEAKVLNQLDLFKGKSETEYKPALEDRLLREEAVALLLRMFGLEEEALKMDDKEANDLLAKFEDADEIAGWARKYVAYAVKNEVVVGRPDGKFAPKDNLIGREYSKMVLAMLGYVQGTDFEYKFASSEFANVTGFSQTETSKFDEEPLIRDNVVGMSFYALMAEYVAGDNAGLTVIEVIVGDDEAKEAIAIEAGLMEEAVVVEVAALDDIVIKVGEELKLPATVKATLSDDSEADVAVTWPAIDTSKAMEKTEIEGTIEGSDVVAKVNVTIEVDALLVDSVTADNLVEVNVVFNQDVSENAAVADKANYTLNVGKIAGVKVDGNTAVLSLNTDNVPKNQTPAKLTVNEKILEAKEEFEFTYFDATLPEVVDIEITGPKSLIINFTEPMKDGTGKVTLKAGNSTLSVNTKLGFSGSAVTVPLYSTLSDGKTYTITINEFEDYAGYKNVIKTIEFVYEKDATPPVATVDEATQQYVKVTFNKPVKGLTPEHFSHTFSAYTALQLSKTDAYPLKSDGTANDNFISEKDSVKTVYVHFHGMITDDNGKGKGLDAGKIERPIPEGESNFRIRTKAGSNEIKDEWGNKFAEETYTISVVADKTAPEVKAIKVETERSISVEFTKNVSFTKDNVEILDADGNKIDGVKVSVTNPGTGKKFTVDFGKKLAGKSILVNIKNVEDTALNANKLASYSEVIEITDTTPPEINKVAYADGEKGAGFLYVFYNETVDSDTALKVSNYFLYDGTEYTKLTGATSFFEGEKIVKIALTKDQYTLAQSATQPGKGLFVTGVKDIAGNEIQPKVNLIAGTLAVANIPAIAYIDPDNTSKGLKVYATATDKIEVTFNQELTKIDDNAFLVNNGDIDLDVVGMDVELSGGVTKAILTVEKVVGETVKKLPYSVEDKNVEVTLKKGTIENAFGTKNGDNVPEGGVYNGSYTLKLVNDKIAPAVKGDLAQNDAKIVLTFTEKVKYTVGADLVASDFVVTNKSDDDKVLEAGKDYTIEKEADDKISIVLYKNYEGSKLNVALNADSKGYITDMNGNKLAKFSKDITMAARSTGVDRADATGGTGLAEYDFAKGVLNISMKAKTSEYTPESVPFVKNPAEKSAYWIGVAIDVPNGVNVTQPVELKVGDKKYTTNLDYDYGFLYYFHAGDVELPSTATDDDVKVSDEQVLEIKWNSTYTEKVTVIYDVVVEKAAD